MTTELLDDLEKGIAHHQKGELAQATRLYQRLLTREPNHPDALHLLGVAAYQQKDAARAVELIGRAVAVRPTVAIFHANLAEAYRALGQLDRAIGCCRTALRLQPGLAEAANNWGLALLDQGKAEAAVAPFEAALRARPDFALASNNLANAWLRLGDKPRAIACFRQAVASDSAFAEAHSNLGQLLLEHGELDEALRHCREAVRLQPDFAEGHNNLGNVLRELDQLTEARACYAEALRLNPDLPLALGNMGQVLQQDGSLAEAVTWYKQALELAPDAARLHCYLASAYEEADNYEDAVASYETALRLDPDFAEAHDGLGWIRHEQGRNDEAMRCYQTALRLKPDFPTAECNLGMLLTELGDFAGAEAAFREVIRRRPQHAGAHAQLATLLRGKLPETDLEVLNRLLADPELSDNRRASLHFGLAHVLDARSQYSQAAEDLRVGNALALSIRRKGGLEYKADDHVRFVDRLIASFNTGFFERLAGAGLATDRPVFIVGLPRSGTTLTEQVLASHSRVYGAGELRLARQDFVSLAGPRGEELQAVEAIERLNAETLRPIAQRHLDQLRELNATAPRIVDKMPDNYLYLGLLAVLFPNAKFIHCRRDLRDVAVSCWMTQFRHIRWASDFDHLASRFLEYRRLMAHWRRVLPVPLLEVDYEEMVADLETTARRLVAWCGLEWEPACLAFHEDKRPVRTASVTQVRQPIYTRSVARWKHYEPALGPLFARLGSDADE